MSIGTNIKKLRRARDLTQEQLAEYLGITPTAVSQWECDRTAPDISQLPQLAYILNITTDELLGVDVSNAEDEITKILEAQQSPYAAGDFGKCAEILHEGLKRYPRSYRLMEKLAHNLSCLGGHDEEVVSLSERVIAECTDNDTRDAAFQTLIYQHNNMGRKSEAIKWAKKMSHMWVSQEEMMTTLLEGEERVKAWVDYLKFCSGRVMMGLNDLAKNDIFTAEDRIALAKQAAAVLEVLYPDGDYHYYADDGKRAYGKMAELYAEQGMAEETLAALEKWCEMTIHFNTYSEDAVNTSPAFRGYVDGGWIPNPDGNQCKLTLDWISSDGRYDFVRDTERYKAAVEKLGKFASV